MWRRIFASDGQLNLRHLLFGIIATFVLVTGGGAWVAMDQVRSLESASDETIIWTEIDATILQVSDQLGGLTTATFGQTHETEHLSVQDEVVRFNMSQRVLGVKVKLQRIGLTNDKEFVDAADRFEQSGLAVIDRSVEAIHVQQDGPADTIDQSLRALQVAHNEFREDLHALTVLTHDARTSGLAERTAEGEQRVQQMLVGMIPLSMLVFALIFLSKRITQREDLHLHELHREQSRLQAIVDCLPLELAWKDLESKILGVNEPLSQNLLNAGCANSIGKRFSEVAPETGLKTWLEVEEMEASAIIDTDWVSREFDVRIDDADHTYRYSCAPLVEDSTTIGIVTFSEDVTEAHRMQKQLTTSGRMESIGQLAAGVAHEINTPVQFVSDNTDFLAESFADLMRATQELAELARANAADDVEKILQVADMDFLSSEVPSALAQSKEGLHRVSEIVHAMKNFSHPGTELTHSDLNGLINATVSISRSEWKYVAELQLELDPNLPLISCREGELKQVMLNMVVNAAHAVAEAHEDGSLGTIGVSTVAMDESVEIKIWDDGAGMSPDVRERIFEQFFTTKPVGKGTGQGLALAWDIVRGHGGTIDVESSPGAGTTFIISLPMILDTIEMAA